MVKHLEQHSHIWKHQRVAESPECEEEISKSNSESAPSQPLAQSQLLLRMGLGIRDRVWLLEEKQELRVGRWSQRLI